MSKIKKKLLIGFILFTVLFFTFFPTQSLAQVDQSFVFDDNVIFNNNDINIPDYSNPYNLKNVSEYTEIYNATYSFTNDIIGSEPKGWTSSNNVNTSTIINASIDGHSNVLEIKDESNVGNAFIINTFINQSEGTVELWIYPTVKTEGLSVWFGEGGEANSVFLRFRSVNIEYFNGTDFIVIQSYSINTWYHFSVFVDVLDDSFDLSINDILLVNNGDTRGIINGFTQIRLRTEDVQEGVWYIDAIGYTWEIQSSEEIDDFTNDIIGSDPKGWSSANTGNSTTIIIEGAIDDRTNILELKDLNGNAFISRDFPEATNQTILFNFTKNIIVASSTKIRLRDSGSLSLQLTFINDDLIITDGVGTQTFNNILTANIFNEYLLILNSVSDTYDLLIDDILIASEVDYVSNLGSMDSVEFNTEAIIDFIAYIDDILFNSINYTINLNLFPFLELSETLQEVNKYEFGLDGINSFTDTDNNNPNGWILFENTPVATTRMEINQDVNDPIVDYDRVIGGFSETAGNNQGINKTFNLNNSKFYNITFTIQFVIFDGIISIGLASINAIEGAEITSIRFQADLDIQYKSDVGFIEMLTNIEILKKYEFNIFLNNEINRVFLSLAIMNEDDSNRTIIETAEYTRINPTAVGLGNVEIETLNIDNEVIAFVIDRVGIYAQGVSQVGINEDLGVASIDLGISSMNLQNNNLMSLIAIGKFHVAIHDDFFSDQAPFTFTTIRNTQDYDDSETIFNLFDIIPFNFDNPFIVFTVNNSHNFSISNLKIDGVVLNESTNSFNLIFEHGSVDTNESFFSVVGSKLQFTHTANDTNLEFIQARFNINDVSSDDLLVSFKSQITNNAFGFLRINFTSTSNLVQMPNIESTTRFILAQNLTIRDIVVLITDRNLDSISGTTSGFISEIQFLVASNIGVSILITSLIAMMIPLIMILIPSLAISKIYGKMLIIPLFILMSIICVASGLIPVWLFFIIGLSSSVFLLKRDKGFD